MIGIEIRKSLWTGKLFPFKKSVAILYGAIMTLTLAVRGGATGLDPTTSYILLLSVIISLMICTAYS